VRAEEIDEDDEDGNNTDNSIDDQCGFSNLRTLREYEDVGDVPRVSNKSFFTPIRDTQIAPSGDSGTPVSKKAIEEDTNKQSLESANLENNRKQQERKNLLEEENQQYEEVSKPFRHNHQLGVQRDVEGASSTIDRIQNTPSKGTIDDEDESRKRDLGALRSSLSFMQAASAQSLNNNLFQENLSSPINSTVSPHEYLARYYQIMQQHQQQAAAAMNGSTVLPTRHHNQL
jgi:hypothetical protein